MVKYSKPRKDEMPDTSIPDQGLSDDDKKRYNDVLKLGRAYTELVNKLYTPVDATNRFINLALDNVADTNQSRQFLLESKTGVRQMTELLNELNGYAKKIEAVLDEISKSKI